MVMECCRYPLTLQSDYNGDQKIKTDVISWRTQLYDKMLLVWKKKSLWGTLSLCVLFRISFSGQLQCPEVWGSSSWEKWAGGRERAWGGTARVPWSPSLLTSKSIAKVWSKNPEPITLSCGCLDASHEEKHSAYLLYNIVLFISALKCDVFKIITEGLLLLLYSWLLYTIIIIGYFITIIVG